MIKKIITYAIVTSLVLLPNFNAQLIPGNSLLYAHAECVNNSTYDKESYVDIAGKLFESFINENSTDHNKVQFENLDREPVKTLESYEIKNIKFISSCYDDNSNIDKFTVRITYDINYTDESDMWLAGNGIISENNWIRNKMNFIDIEKVNGEYAITQIYT